ncbi:ubiquinone oxidoreductase 20 kd subunit [Phlebopus sp. FC_14]|nr:ubiquinone oxidoreductase 20 kd subunit [Phlebopus sp. FC_14]
MDGNSTSSCERPRQLVHNAMLNRRFVFRVPQLRTLSRASSSSSKAVVPALEKTPVAQSPNYPTTWSTNQNPRPAVHAGPRFEQTFMELQPNPLSAMELIANEPVRVVQGRKAVCDGGGGPLGHPKIFINVDQPGPQPCGYCGLRFEQAPHHGHEH